MTHGLRGKLETNKVFQGNVLNGFGDIPDETVNCIVTSPPYWSLRDYGTATWEGGDPNCIHKTSLYDPEKMSPIQSGNIGSIGVGALFVCPKCGAKRVDEQLGLEHTPEEYVHHMVQVFSECWRILRKDGVFWLNIGDTYAGNNVVGRTDTNRICQYGQGTTLEGRTHPVETPGLKKGDLCGVPWRLALALQQPFLRCVGCGNVAHQMKWGKYPDGRLICPECEQAAGHEIFRQGWWLRSDVIWSKITPMPESVTNRCTKSHEYIFQFTKHAGTPLFYTHRDKLGTYRQQEPEYVWISANGYESKEEPADWKTSYVESCGVRVKEWKRFNLWEGHDYYFDSEAIRVDGEGTLPVSRNTGKTSLIKAENPSGHNKWSVWSTTDLQTKILRYFADGSFPGGDEGLTRFLNFMYEILGMSSTNKADVWNVATANFEGSHFATYPIELIAPCILATCPENVCAVCGAPHVRIVKREAEELYNSAQDGLYGDDDNATGPKPFATKHVTVGFRPTCECNGEIRRGIVFDPFMGAGTSALTALLLGRSYLGYELNPEYIEIINKRLEPYKKQGKLF